MEIFSNIWNVLTTEHSKTINLFLSPTIIIESILVFELFTQILHISYNNKQKNLYVISFIIISLFVEFIIPSPFNIFLNYITMFIIIKIDFNLNLIKSILAVIIPTVIFALTGTLILKPILIISNLTYEQLEFIPLYRFIYQCILYFCIYVLIFLLKHVDLNINLKEDFNSKNKKIILLNLLFALLTLCVQLSITVFYTDILPFIFTFFNFISLFSYFFISFYSLSKTMKLQITTRDLETAESYNATLSYLYDNVKAFKHDFDNMIFIIGGYILNNDLDGLKVYYKNLQKDCEKVNELALLNPELINNSGIYNLLMSKYKKANEYNVEIHLEYFFDLQKLKMTIYDFSRILGILLDNALEAAKDSDEKQVNILFRDSQRNNTQIIAIENSYSNKDVDTSLIFEKGKTSKINHSGMGLWEVKQILNRNNNVNIITAKDKIYFEQTIEIYY